MKNGPYELVVAPPGYPGKLYRGRYCYEHHLVWWRHTGEVPGPGELIHHKNENKRDNRYKNLKKETKGEHNTYHHTVSRVRLVCAYCKKQFEILPSVLRSRQKNSAGGKFFCTRRCAARHQFQTIAG